MNKSLKWDLASKLFEFLDHRKAREEFAIQILMESEYVNGKYKEVISIINDPPDFILIDKNDNRISCEVTEVHTSPTAQAKLTKYHKLLKKLKVSLAKEGFDHLYGVFWLNHNDVGILTSEDFLDYKNQEKFINETILILKKCYKNYEEKSYISNEEFENNTLLKRSVDYITLFDYSKKSSEKNFYWWFSHLQSGENETAEISLEYINEIISKKDKKMQNKILEKKYKENWLILYSTSFGLYDLHIPPSCMPMDLDNKSFDKIYFVSPFFGVTLLFQK